MSSVFSDMTADEDDDGLDVTAIVNPDATITTDRRSPAEQADAGVDPVDVSTVPIFDACRVKFLGASGDLLMKVPALGESVEFTVSGVVTAHGEELARDGRRDTATIKVESVSF